ncbi:MAG TPA: ParA family protein [Kineosporiaceae bacterium]|nr:ParA family protein [Kineosporiaceae bacterium]
MIVVSVCSLKGGVGKTSVVLGLASAALIRGVPTLVVDLDPQADATTALNVDDPAANPVASVLSNPRRKTILNALTPSGWSEGQPGLLDVVQGSAASSAHDSLRATDRALSRLGTALERTDGYQLVLVDCPPSFGTLTRSGLVASHRAIVVTEPALFSVTAADRALRAIDELRRSTAPALQPLGVVVNRYRDRSPEHRYRLTELGEMFGPLVLSPAIPERSVLQQAQGASMPVHRWPGAAAHELSEAFDAHLARVLRTGSRPPRRPSTARAVGRR